MQINHRFILRSQSDLQNYEHYNNLAKDEFISTIQKDSNYNTKEKRNSSGLTQFIWNKLHGEFYNAENLPEFSSSNSAIRESMPGIRSENSDRHIIDPYLVYKFFVLYDKNNDKTNSFLNDKNSQVSVYEDNIEFYDFLFSDYNKFSDEEFRDIIFFFNDIGHDSVGCAETSRLVIIEEKGLLDEYINLILNNNDLTTSVSSIILQKEKCNDEEARVKEYVTRKVFEYAIRNNNCSTIITIIRQN